MFDPQNHIVLIDSATSKIIFKLTFKIISNMSVLHDKHQFRKQPVEAYPGSHFPAVGFKVEAASSWLAASPDAFCTFSAKVNFPSVFKSLLFNMLAFMILFEPLQWCVFSHSPLPRIFQSFFFSTNGPSVSLLAMLFSLFSSPLGPWLAAIVEMAKPARWLPS